MEISTEGIDDGVRRLKDFYAVHKARPERRDRLRAMANFMEAAGVSEDVRTHLQRSIQQIVDGDRNEQGWAMLGVMVGLFIAQFEQEKWDKWMHMAEQ